MKMNKSAISSENYNLKTAFKINVGRLEGLLLVGILIYHFRSGAKVCMPEVFGKNESVDLRWTRPARTIGIELTSSSRECPLNCAQDARPFRW